MTDDSRARIARWLAPAVLEREAYRVGEAGGLIKLDAMENPYPWPEPLRALLAERLREVAINRYPDAAAGELKGRLAAALDVPAGLELVLGNGSDELIQLLAMAFAGPGRVLLSPEPGFSMYPLVAGALGMRYAGVALRPDFSLDREAMLAAIAREQPALVFIAYPNNPTGNLFDVEAVHAVIEAAPGLVVVDEAYFPFAGASFAAAIARYPNLVVLRTLSKMGFAGLRLGLMLAAPAWAREFEKLRLPYNVNSLTQATLNLALEHLEVFAAQSRSLIDARESLAGELAALDGLEVFPSAANFLLVRCAARLGDVGAALRERGVLVKDVGAAHPLTARCVRITIGTPEENRALLAALRSVAR